MSDMMPTGSKYTDEDRRQAVIGYCVLGNMAHVSWDIDIPKSTLYAWKKSDWWLEETVKVRQEIGDQILAQNMQIATKAGERVLDSLVNGDEKLVWDKTKCNYVIKRVKPSGKDAAVMGGISQDKARVAMNMPTSITGQSQDYQALAKQFKELSEQWDEKQVNVVAVQEKSEEIE